jgi:hypothetical protein
MASKASGHNTQKSSWHSNQPSEARAQQLLRRVEFCRNKITEPVRRLSYIWTDKIIIEMNEKNRQEECAIGNQGDLMGTKVSSYHATAGEVRSLKQDWAIIRQRLLLSGNGELKAKIGILDQFFSESIFYVGVPHETYPTRVVGADLNLEGIPDHIAVRIETTKVQLEEVDEVIEVAIGQLESKGDTAAAEKAKVILTVLQKIGSETYCEKTHQVSSFDSMAQRLTY